MPTKVWKEVVRIQRVFLWGGGVEVEAPPSGKFTLEGGPCCKIGEAPLSVVFPQLFSLSNHKDGKVNDFYELLDGSWNWSFSWRRELFQWEEDLVTQLREVLDPVVLSLEEDYWRWRPGPDGLFSVNSSYNLLVDELREEEELADERVMVFRKIWDSPAPSKVIAFSSQLLYDRIPTRKNLENEIFRWLGIMLVVPPSLDDLACNALEVGE
ncbi:hypothetical protein TSUD_30280 [Trifolium subterraneum]|uniref:Reverse transcriptase zinc-binding domain-containing protein n=1 Tax=Trifolium subterraneum TaxID=3900 RepID=A0A2Z6MW40_TRISU|nr:hypothetical protein TSUD_30280 [Trifolium subterraneum]